MLYSQLVTLFRVQRSGLVRYEWVFFGNVNNWETKAWFLRVVINRILRPFHLRIEMAREWTFNG